MWKNVIKQVPNVQRFEFIFGGKRWTHYEWKCQEDKGILYIQRVCRLRCKHFSKWNGSLIVLEELETKAERTYEWNKLSSRKWQRMCKNCCKSCFAIHLMFHPNDKPSKDEIANIKIKGITIGINYMCIVPHNSYRFRFMEQQTFK